MSKKERSQDEWQKSHDRMIRTITRMAGKSLAAALRDTFIKQEVMDNHLYNICYSVGDNPYTRMTIAHLDRRRLLLDMAQYDQVINATHEEVKKEVKKAAEEAIEEMISEFNK